jgi:putative ABC transport system permease protein
MLRFIKQVGPLLKLGLQTVSQRKGTSSVIVIGIAGVVAVLISMLAIGTGLDRSLQGGGRDDNVLLMSAGSGEETASAISRDTIPVVTSLPQVAHAGNGTPIASAEIVTVFPAKFNKTMEDGNVSLRGVGKQGLTIHSDIQLVDGQMFRPGLQELIVGVGVARMFHGFGLGDKVRIGNGIWTVTGHYTSQSIHDSEVLCDIDTLQSALGMGTYVNSIYVRLRSRADLQGFKDDVARNATLHLVTQVESEYFASQSESMSGTLRTIAYAIGTIMALGALFGSIHSLYISADARKTEMATLRAIGFRNDSIIAAFMIEAVVLSLVGGCIGAALAWAAFNGYTASTINTGLSQVVFKLSVSWSLVTTGITWACAIGLLGALVPAIRAARLPVAVALRA